jgi:hypothetical protein
MKIRPVGVESFHADRLKDGRTDIKKLIVAFRNFANVPKNSQLIFRDRRACRKTVLEAEVHERLLCLKR